jgi:signal transduction histidine kinase
MGAVPLLRLSDQVKRSERVTRGDWLDIPADRVIAQGRLVLCALSLIALHFDPHQPTQLAMPAYTVLQTYFAFAAVMVYVGLRFRAPPEAQYAVHLADIAFTSILMFLTEGPTSPFFLFFTFVLLSATMRWNWRAVVATAAIMAAVLLAVTPWLANPPASTADSVTNELTKDLIRGAYLVVAAAMLAYVSAYRERRRARLEMLAGWAAHDQPSKQAPTLEKTLAQAVQVFEAPRAFAVWEESEEPFVNVASWQEGDYGQTREGAGALGDLIRPKYKDLAFLTEDVTSGLVLTPRYPLWVEPPLIDSGLMARFDIHSVATAPFGGTTCSGRVFILDRGNWSDDHVLLVEIVASRIGMELERQLLQLRTEQNALTQERVRLTRDLHDGILQSLTAAALQLKLSTDAPGQSLSRLDTVKQLLEAEQRRIRSFVNDTLPKTALGHEIFLSRDLQNLLLESGRHWDCATSLTVDPHDARVPGALGIQINLMLAEAVANAVRHGGASAVDVRIERTGNLLRINIHDNGRGFGPAAARFDHEDLRVSGKGPASLRERVGELGGSLAVATSPAGAELTIQVPVS